MWATMVSNKGSFYYIFFGIFSFIFGAVLYWYLRDHIADVDFYGIWLLTLTITTFVMYFLDWLLAKIFNWIGTQDQDRVPRNILHALAILGGFLGGWVGMFLLGHKISSRNPKNRWFKPILAASTVAHGLLIYWLYFYKGT